MVVKTEGISLQVGSQGTELGEMSANLGVLDVKAKAWQA
jgi:hypothetical protein